MLSPPPIILRLAKPSFKASLTRIKCGGKPDWSIYNIASVFNHMKSHGCWANSWGNSRSCYYLCCLLPDLSFTNGFTSILNWYTTPQKLCFNSSYFVLLTLGSGGSGQQVSLASSSFSDACLQLPNTSSAEVLKPVFCIVSEFFFLHCCLFTCTFSGSFQYQNLQQKESCQAFSG